MAFDLEAAMILIEALKLSAQEMPGEQLTIAKAMRMIAELATSKDECKMIFGDVTAAERISQKCKLGKAEQLAGGLSRWTIASKEMTEAALKIEYIAEHDFLDIDVRDAFKTLRTEDAKV